MVSTQCSSQSSNAVWSLAISTHICCDLDNASGRKARHLRTSRGGAVASLLETTGRSRRHTAIYDALCIAYPYFQNAAIYDLSCRSRQGAPAWSVSPEDRPDQNVIDVYSPVMDILATAAEGCQLHNRGGNTRMRSCTRANSIQLMFCFVQVYDHRPKYAARLTHLTKADGG